MASSTTHIEFSTANSALRVISCTNPSSETIKLQFEDEAGWQDIADTETTGDMRGTVRFPTTKGRLHKSGSAEVHFNERPL